MGKAASIMFALIYSAISAHAQSLSAEDLNQRNIERRAVEAVIWGMPAVNTQLLYDATLGAGGNFNQVVYWSRLISWKNQTLTPNPDTIYFFPFYDTRVGPVVLEIPPADRGSITGSVDDAWQTAIEDVGPAGVDKGNGGKYLLLPPGYDGKVPAGYIPMRSSAYTGFAILRSNLKSASDDDIAEAVAYGKRIKLYPLSQTSKPPPTKFVDAIDARYGNVIPYNVKFFEELDRFVQREPWLERDKAMIDQLKSIGIEIPTRKPERFSKLPHTKLRSGLTRNTRPFSHCPISRVLIGPSPRPLISSRRCRQISRALTAIRPMSVAQSIRLFTSAPSISATGSSTSWKSRTVKGDPSMVGKATILMCPPTPRSNCTGPRPPMTVILMPSFVTFCAAVAPPILPTCKRTRIVRLTFGSGRKRLSARSRIGCRHTPVPNSRCYFAFMVPRSHYSTRRGSCQTSK
jgi:hypothetical protein